VLFCQRHFAVGTSLIIVGRLCDVLDGWLARRTHTASPFGEGLDAGVDKLVILLAAILLLAMHIVPWPLIVLAAVLQAGIALIVLGARRVQVLLHPSRLGKYSMFGLWVAVALYLVAFMLKENGTHSEWVFAAAQLCMMAAITGYVLACVRYLRQIRYYLSHK
jgi:phosphatidylglycerophosphate synthase